MNINPLDIIKKKRDGKKLSPSEIHAFVHAYSQGSIPDYQVAAWLMAVYFQGMDIEETVVLTEAMLASGESIDLSDIGKVVVDKHSTGGVGDKTSLILGPMVAALGVKVAKLSGRGLGHSGGTIDKLESIPGFNVECSLHDFITQVNEIGIALMGQTKDLVPADKKLYALRDVTGTVDCLPLIASSIMSKKLASGAGAIVLDVKTGSGSFNATLDRSIELAKLLVHLGERMGRKTIALITEMDQPLGNAIGNALEVQESIDTLNGNGPKDLEQLCIELGSYMINASDSSISIQTAQSQLSNSLKNGSAATKFQELIKAQNGSLSHSSLSPTLPISKKKVPLYSNETGYITKIQADTVGRAAMILGAGRITKSDQIDHAVGVYLEHKVGAYVEKGELLAQLHVNDESKLPLALSTLKSAYTVEKEAASPRPLIWAKIDNQGLKIYDKE